MNDFDPILDFWFEGITDETVLERSLPAIKKWFAKDPAFDRKIKDTFEATMQKAAAGEFSDWEKTIKGRLALVILFDQFPRNIYRNTSEMFATDPLAVGLTMGSIDQNVDQGLSLIERVFLYMPLMHSEERSIQEISLKSYSGLCEEVAKKFPQNIPYYQYTYDFAKRHHAIIERFGRFPHRNRILGRMSSNEEEEFLKTKGSSF